MKIYHALFIIVCLTLFACSNEKNEPQAETPGEEMPFSPDELPITSIFKNTDSSFVSEGFAETNKSAIEASEATTIDQTDVKHFLTVLIYSPDSNYAIDPYSYNYIFRKGRKGRSSFDEAGPDSEVALVNLQDSTRRRIWFGGPSAVLLKTDWINDREIAIAGAELLEDNKGLPFVLIININKGEISHYENGDTLDYVDRRLLKEELEQRWSVSKPSTRLM